MGDRDGCVPLEEEEGHWLPHDQRAADDQRAGAFNLRFRLVEQADAAGWSARAEAFTTHCQRGDIARTEAIDVLLGCDQVDDRVGVNVLG